MPLTLPKLDDRTYDDLLEEARALIPTYAPQWTNHNPSDPGITLIELFAYLTEMLIYRLDRVTDDNMRAFLKLLNGPEWQPSGKDLAALQADMRSSVLALRRRERAITCQDFETLALSVDSRINRAHCVPGRNLLADFEMAQPAHVSIVIVPEKGAEAEVELLKTAVQTALEPRRLLTTHLHVVGPQYITVAIQTTLTLLPDVPALTEADDIKQRVITDLQAFFAPLNSGPDKPGWPFGRNVYLSEIYERLDKLPGVDFVGHVRLAANIPDRDLIKEGTETFIGIEVKAHELVQVKIALDDIDLIQE